MLLVFDAPLAPETAALAGGNLAIIESRRRGRDAADHEIVDRLALDEERGDTADVRVVTSDRGLQGRIPDWATVWGVGRFRELIGY